MVLNFALFSFCHVTISQPLKHQRRDKKGSFPSSSREAQRRASFLQPLSEMDKGVQNISFQRCFCVSLYI